MVVATRKRVAAKTRGEQRDMHGSGWAPGHKYVNARLSVERARPDRPRLLIGSMYFFRAGTQALWQIFDLPLFRRSDSAGGRRLSELHADPRSSGVLRAALTKMQETKPTSAYALPQLDNEQKTKTI